MNPDCQKILPEHLEKNLGYYWNYCDEICLRWHYALKKLYRKNSFGLKFKINPNLVLTPEDRMKDYLCNYYYFEHLKHIGKIPKTQKFSEYIQLKELSEQESQSFTEYVKEQKQKEVKEK